MAGNTSQPSIKRVWGIAKSPELKLTDEELHLLVQAHTGKDSIKALNKRELQTVIDRKSTRLNSSHNNQSRMPSSA